MFVVKGESILLIEKKRGLGAGKINGPGGKIDPGETPMEAVMRETLEELHITQRMWEDDQHWLPLLLAEQTFLGRFIFQGETMTSMELATGIVW